MTEEIREQFEEKISHFLERIESSCPESELLKILGEAREMLDGLAQDDEDVIREYGLVGVYYTGLDEKIGLEVLTKAFELSDKLGLIDFPAPFIGEDDKPYNTIVYATMASFLSSAKNPAAANKYFEIAYKKFEAEKDGISMACYALDYSGCLLAVNNTEKAIEILHQGIQASYDAFGESNPIALSLMKGLSMLYKKLGNKEEEEKYEKMYVDMYDKLEEEEDSCDCGCGHDHHHHHDEDCDCGCGHDHHHHHDDDCDCGCHH